MLIKNIVRLKLDPINLTEKEDWVWLRLCDYDLFEQNEVKGRKRWLETHGSDLIIEKTVTNDMSAIMDMIKELAIYEDMLDQCSMTTNWLTADYVNPPIPKADGKLVGPTFISTIAWFNNEPIGYTVSIGK